MARRLDAGEGESVESCLTVQHALVYNVYGQLALVRLAVILLLYILDEFLALRSAALVEAGIDGVFIGIHQLAHGHAEEQRLAVALGDAEAAQQLGGYLAGLVVGVEHMTRSDGVNAEIVGQLPSPVAAVVAALLVPGIAAPGLIPHPVAVQLLEALAVGQTVGGIGPVPVGGLWIEMQTLGVVGAVHGLHRLLDECRAGPPPGFEVCKDVHVVDVYGGGCCQLLVGLTPWSAGRIGGQRLTSVLRHGVDVRIEWQRFAEHQWAVGVVRAQHDRRYVLAT